MVHRPRRHHQQQPSSLASQSEGAGATTTSDSCRCIPGRGLPPAAGRLLRATRGEQRCPVTIAAQLVMSLNTVKTHLSHIFTKLDITSRAELARLVTLASA